LILNKKFNLKAYRIGPYHPLDGVSNLQYKLLHFLTPNKIIFKEEGDSF
jgi:hypothetical protein